MKYAIYDWAGNRIMPSMEFQTFEDGWDYILGELTDRLGLTEDDYQEYQVIDMYRDILAMAPIDREKYLESVCPF